MVDIQPASPALTSSTATPAAAAAASNLTSVQVVVADVSQALQDLSRMIQTGATITAVQNAASITLTTALGNVTVSLPQQLSATEKQNLTQQLISLLQSQRPITLTLQPGSPPTQGTLFIPSQVAPPAPPTPYNIQVPAASVLPAQTLAPGENLPAIVLPSLPAAAQTVPAPAANPAAGTAPVLAPPVFVDKNAAVVPQIPNAVSRVIPVATAPVPATMENVETPAPVAATPPQPVPGATPAPRATPMPPLSLQMETLLRPGSEVTLRVDAVLPNFVQENVATPLPPLVPNQILATVTGTGTDGQLILKAGNATLFVKAQIPPPPPGTAVILTVEAAKPMPLVTLPQPEQTGFPSLPQVMAALAQANPVAAQQIMAMHIPQPTEALPGALLFLFSAVKQGNARGWLGSEATDSLIRAGKAELIDSLTRDLGNAAQPAQDPVVGQWTTYPIPLFAQQQFQSLALHVHSDRDARQDKDNPAPNKIRFLIDMRLSRLGSMQIDGFVQPRKLDMVLRSENGLPEGLHHELRGSYIKALGAVGYTGTLNFQIGRQHWMNVRSDAPKGIVT